MSHEYEVHGLVAGAAAVRCEVQSHTLLAEACTPSPAPVEDCSTTRSTRSTEIVQAALAEAGFGVLQQVLLALDPA